MSKTDASCDSKLSSRWKIKTQRINSDTSQQHLNLLQQQALDEAVRTKHYHVFLKLLTLFSLFVCFHCAQSFETESKTFYNLKYLRIFCYAGGKKGQNHEKDDAIFCTLVALRA